MITKEEIEILKNSNKDKQKKEEYEAAMAKFKTESAAAVERFENVIDNSFRNRIKWNRENDECKKNIIVAFKTNNIFQIAALSHIIKKYLDAGFKIFPMKSKVSEKQFSSTPKRENDIFEKLLQNSYSNYKTTFVRSDEDLNEIVERFNNIVKTFSNFDNCYKKIMKDNHGDHFDLFGIYWNDGKNEILEKIRFIDILNGAPFYYLEGWMPRVNEEQVLEFSLE